MVLHAAPNGQSSICFQFYIWALAIFTTGGERNGKNNDIRLLEKADKSEYLDNNEYIQGKWRTIFAGLLVARLQLSHENTSDINRVLCFGCLTIFSLRVTTTDNRRLTTGP